MWLGASVNFDLPKKQQQQNKKTQIKTKKPQTQTNKKQQQKTCLYSHAFSNFQLSGNLLRARLETYRPDLILFWQGRPAALSRRSGSLGRMVVMYRRLTVTDTHYSCWLAWSTWVWWSWCTSGPLMTGTWPSFSWLPSAGASRRGSGWHRPTVSARDRKPTVLARHPSSPPLVHANQTSPLTYLSLDQFISLCPLTAKNLGKIQYGLQCPSLMLNQLCRDELLRRQNAAPCLA